MSGRFRLGQPNDTAFLQQRLPFSNADVEELNSEPSTSLRSKPRTAKATRSQSSSSNYLSSSHGHHIPTRSFFHHASHGAGEPPQYSSFGVREQTQELASWTLGESLSVRQASDPYHVSSASDSELDGRPNRQSLLEASDHGDRTSMDSSRPIAEEVIEEISEPISPEDSSQENNTTGQASGLTELMRDTSPYKRNDNNSGLDSGVTFSEEGRHYHQSFVDDVETGEVNEVTPLLPRERLPSRIDGPQCYQKPGFSRKPIKVHIMNKLEKLRHDSMIMMETITHPKNWNMHQVLNQGVSALAAVFLGVLLNLLDALSYGMILFPLGEPIFEKTGPDGISMFYVSCIVSQLVYSFGGSRFKGGVGSEMIEVVPFFHKMAYMILLQLGPENPQAVMATVITAYALSSILTGLIFALLAAFRLGDLVSFFPRSILLGCIGGVGVFLFLTGLEVSAGLDSNMEWSLDTLERLLYPQTLALWLIPFMLCVLLLLVRKQWDHPTVMPVFFILVTGVFYAVFAALPNVSLNDMQKHGWVFAAPEAGVPFYNFYSYFNFKLVVWRAVFTTIPTMFALSFFGIIHVPINVPALGVAVGEDDIDINRELLGHGLSNALSGLCGSIQNYLVFANSRLFIDNGGNSRWAGVLLAIGTIGVWVAGPAMIGYIPILVVGTLIFMLGVEMIKEALWDTYGMLHRLEWLMVLAITLVMGFHDFVVGIMLGIVLACLQFVINTSRISAIRATYSGTIAESTVRRHPVQRRFLHAVGSQLQVFKLAGYLFFGTIVAVEKKIRHIIKDESFEQHPIRYLILDLSHVSGMDFSAAEAFVRMHKILRAKEVEMVLSGVSIKDEVGKSLTMVGLFAQEENSSCRPPRFFYDLNQALEACENDLLIAFKRRTEGLVQQKGNEVHSMTIPRLGSPRAGTGFGPDQMFSSPRRNHVQEAVTTALNEHDLTVPSRWQNFAQPLPLILQTFKDLTEKDLDFWHRAVPYFQRREYMAGQVLYSRGDEPDGFYMLEEGILRADYDMEQGGYYESIVAGTTCGELPFFSKSQRTATVFAEKDCVAWVLTRDRWKDLMKDLPEVSNELLTISLQLTNERMNTITSYVLVTAS